MTEVEKCRRELEYAEREARRPGLSAAAQDNRRQLVERAMRKLHQAEERDLRDRQRDERRLAGRR